MLSGSDGTEGRRIGILKEKKEKEGKSRTCLEGPTVLREEKRGKRKKRGKSRTCLAGPTVLREEKRGKRKKGVKVGLA